MVHIRTRLNGLFRIENCFRMSEFGPSQDGQRALYQPFSPFLQREQRLAFFRISTNKCCHVATRPPPMQATVPWMENQILQLVPPPALTKQSKLCLLLPRPTATRAPWLPTAVNTTATPHRCSLGHSSMPGVGRRGRAPVRHARLHDHPPHGLQFVRRPTTLPSSSTSSYLPADACMDPSVRL